MKDDPFGFDVVGQAPRQRTVPGPREQTGVLWEEKKKEWLGNGEEGGGEGEKDLAPIPPPYTSN